MYIFVNMKSIASLKVRPIPIQTDAQHPPPPHDILPKHEFTLGFIAPKGSGKTTTLCNLLLFYAGYFHTIVVFSPTVANDEKWVYIKQQKLLARNRELETFIRSLTTQDPDRHPIMPPPWEYSQLTKSQKDLTDEDTFTGRIPDKLFMTEYDESVLKKLLDEQQSVIDFLEAHGKSKHLANRLLLVFDDLVGSSLFSGSRKNVFKQLNTRHRHYSASLLVVSQAYKELPRTVRINVSGLILFDIANEKEIETIYEENPCFLKKDAWLEVYHHAVSQPYAFLFIK